MWVDFTLVKVAMDSDDSFKNAMKFMHGKPSNPITWGKPIAIWEDPFTGQKAKAYRFGPKTMLDILEKDEEYSMGGPIGPFDGIADVDAYLKTYFPGLHHFPVIK